MFTSSEAELRYADFVAAAPDIVIGLDFDGTLAPIVDDPTQAHIHPGAADVLVELSESVRALAIVTGRPARQVIALGDLDDLGERIRLRGKELSVFGQYGAERWTSTHRAIHSPRPPHGLASFERDLPRALREARASEAYVEDKGLAVAVHTRRLADAGEAFARLLPVLRDLAAQHSLVLEPGRAVIEVRSGEMDKGRVVEELVRGARGVMFVGDDLGDIEALQAVDECCQQGLAGLRVVVANPEAPRLVAHADVLLEGPDAVMVFLLQLARDIAAA